MKKQPYKPESKKSLEYVSNAAFYWKEKGAWNVQLVMPDWIAKDMQEMGNKTMVFISRPIQDQEGIFFPAYQFNSSLVLEQSPSSEELAEMLAEQKLADDITNEMLVREIKQRLIETQLKKCEDFDCLYDMAHAIYYDKDVRFSQEELRTLWDKEILPDLARRGEYSFSFDGKRVEGVVGVYTGFGSWTIYVVNSNSTFVFYGSTMAKANSLVVTESELEQTIWLLASAFAVGRTWEAFIDPTRPRKFSATRTVEPVHTTRNTSWTIAP